MSEECETVNDDGRTEQEALFADVEALRRLVDLAARAGDALASTTVRPAELPAWWWEVASELHRVGSHAETPDSERTSRLEEHVEAAYDQQVTDPAWWDPDEDATSGTPNEEARPPTFHHAVEERRSPSTPEEPSAIDRVPGRERGGRHANKVRGEAEMSEVIWRGDLTRDEEAAYLRTRRLTGADGIQRTLAEIEHRAADPSHPDALRDLLATAGTIIESLRRQLDLQEALWRASEERRIEQTREDTTPPDASGEPHAE